MKENVVRIYTAPACGPCKLLKYHMTKAEIPFIELSISEEENRTSLIEAGFRNVPIVEINGKFIESPTIEKVQQNV